MATTIETIIRTILFMTIIQVIAVMVANVSGLSGTPFIIFQLTTLLILVGFVISLRIFLGLKSSR